MLPGIRLPHAGMVRPAQRRQGPVQGGSAHPFTGLRTLVTTKGRLAVCQCVADSSVSNEMLLQLEYAANRRLKFR